MRPAENSHTAGGLKLRWLGGAGFVVTAGALTIGIDVYLSNSCMQEDGTFKRLTAAPVRAEDLSLDYLIASHEHGDHLDVGSVDALMRPHTKLVCPGDTKTLALSCAVEESAILELNRGQTIRREGFTLRAVIADHGEGSDDAIGIFLKIAGKTIYFMGDAGFRGDMLELTAPREDIDVLLVPINGRFGNPDAREASAFTRMFAPKVVVPCHFWLFAEHGGNPGEFAAYCAEAAPDTRIKILGIGEEIEIA